MRLSVLFALCLALCVVLSVADRRRADRDDDGDVTRRRHHSDDDDDDDDDDDRHHRHERRFDHLADFDRRSHDHERRGRPDREHPHDRRPDREEHSHDRRRDRQDQDRPLQEVRRGHGDTQERRSEGQGERRDHRNGDASHGLGKNGKKPHQSERWSDERREDHERHGDHERRGDHHGNHERRANHHDNHERRGDHHYNHERRGDHHGNHERRGDHHGNHERRGDHHDNEGKRGNDRSSKLSQGRAGMAAQQTETELQEQPGQAETVTSGQREVRRKITPADVTPAEAWEDPAAEPGPADAPEAAGSQQVPVAFGSEPVSPPPHQEVAAMARYIVHVSDWAAMATISTRAPTRGMPFANVFSVSDGTRYRSSGVPYLYLTDMEISVQDLRVDSSASLTMSLAQTDFCRRHEYDPEDPLCAHVILTGQILEVEESDPEWVFARDALFSRHPEMSGWPADHRFFVAKLDIQNIIVLDYFGGAKTVTTEDYFATDPFRVKVGDRHANEI